VIRYSQRCFRPNCKSFSIGDFDSNWENVPRNVFAPDLESFSVNNVKSDGNGVFTGNSVTELVADMLFQ